ncbi:hypothetical protein [Curtobacterium sp. MCBA15_004]|uniref:hypothetical protein n=1 Tax=Curtobacterium sp. MCBA15_004 TaxID=1898733 RepID=UPI0008DCE9B7|nr:hypothetical protein [Curtobacterium sp. MCBA15_004]WIA96406.1 hypothetical protein QOL16_15110 [Curtobacterium sp. MCBA15_004]
MAITIWPANATNGVPAVAGRGLRQTSVGVPLGGATAARPLGLYSGVRPGTPTSTVTVGNNTVTVAPHAGAIDAQTAAEAGGYEYSSDSAVAVKTGLTQDQSNPRVDLVSVQVSDPSESDGSAVPQVQFVYTQGAPASTPLAPGDSGSSVAAPGRSFPIARVNVPKSGGGNPTVTWVAPYCLAAGGTLVVNQLADLTDALAALFPPRQRAVVLATEQTFEVRTVSGTKKWVAGAGESRAATYTTLSAGVPDGGPYGIGTITPVAAQTVNNDFATVAGSAFTLTSGTYVASASGTHSPTTTPGSGRDSFIQLNLTLSGAGGVNIGRNSFGPGEDSGNTAATFVVPPGATATLSPVYFKQGGGIPNFTSIITITKIGG